MKKKKNTKISIFQKKVFSSRYYIYYYFFIFYIYNGIYQNGKFDVQKKHIELAKMVRGLSSETIYPTQFKYTPPFDFFSFSF